MGLSAEVTLRTLVLGAQDSVTGWYAPSYTESDIDMIIQPRGTRVAGMPAGIFAREDAVGINASPTKIGDQIKTQANIYYEIISIKKHSLLDSFMYYETQLHELPMYQEGATTADVFATPRDPRERTRVWIDTYLTPVNITKEDGSLASTITAFGMPDYPITKVYLTKGVDGVFALMEVESSPLIGHDQSIHGYDEVVPIQLLAINKPEVMGTKLIQRMENELRSIAETYPLGSQRNLNSKRDVTTHLGSTTIYGREWRLNYRRDTT